jgi:hypothetical protein
VREKRQVESSPVITSIPFTCTDYGGVPGTFAYWKYDHEVPSTCESEFCKTEEV